MVLPLRYDVQLDRLSGQQFDGEWLAGVDPFLNLNALFKSITFFLLSLLLYAENNILNYASQWS